VNYLCPACHRSVAVAAGAAELRCPGCALAAPLSRVGTAPGVAVPVALDRTGTELAGYRLEARIGAGGMGTVYRAVPEAGGAAVAIKLLHPDAARGELIERFRREGEALRRLVHPRIVRLIDLGEVDGVPYLVTELVDGRDLAAELAARRPSVSEAAAIAIQVCEGVAAAHAAGIVHRDLKPANVLVGAGGAKVVDFGLAQLAGDPLVASLTRTDVAMGTINYLAPEQRRSAKAVDARADVFALGVMFYEMITGELPLGRFRLPSERGLPKACDAIVTRSLDPEPDRRYRDAAEMAVALAPLVARPATGTARVRRLALVAATLAAGAGGAVAIAAVAQSDGGGAPRSSAAVRFDAAVAVPPPVDAPRSPPDAAPPDAAVDAAPPPPDARPRAIDDPGGKVPRKLSGKKGRVRKPVGKQPDK
jgi:hypothetical protein